MGLASDANGFAGSRTTDDQDSIVTASFRRRTCNGDPYTEERSQIALLGSGVVNGKILSELRGCTRRNSESWEGLIADF